MKLLFIIHNIAYCGAERVLSIIVNELAAREHQVYVLTDPQNVAYGINSKVTILDAYDGIDINKKKNRLGTAIRYVKLMSSQFRIVKRTLHDVEPDVIVSFMGMCIWQLLPYRKKKRIIISDHSAMDREFSCKMNFERRRLPECFTYQTVLTEADKAFLGGSRSNVVVVNDPLTFPIISKSQYDLLYPQRSRLLACGSLDRYYIKGIDSLIKAFAIATKGHSDWVLDIAGGGSDDKIKELKELVEKENISSQVVFLGFRDDMKELMMSHSLFVHAPRSEGFGMVITEAMASGCPVVSYALSGPSEIIENNKDGILVENQNINALAGAIIEMMLDAEKRYSLGINALESVKRFSIESVVNKWESLFKG